MALTYLPARIGWFISIAVMLHLLGGCASLCVNEWVRDGRNDYKTRFVNQVEFTSEARIWIGDNGDWNLYFRNHQDGVLIFPMHQYEVILQEPGDLDKITAYKTVLVHWTTGAQEVFCSEASGDDPVAQIDYDPVKRTFKLYLMCKGSVYAKEYSGKINGLNAMLVLNETKNLAYVLSAPVDLVTLPIQLYILSTMDIGH